MEFNIGDRVSYKCGFDKAIDYISPEMECKIVKKELIPNKDKSILEYKYCIVTINKYEGFLWDKNYYQSEIPEKCLELWNNPEENIEWYNSQNEMKSFIEYTKEEADYRNVTGYGSMGSPSDQNTGPSFNKGPDSATYNRPDVIGVQQIDMNDPYFGEQRMRKKQKIRKNKYVEKLRKDKTKYLKDLDSDTNKNILTENTKTRLKRIGKEYIMSEIFKELGEDKDKMIEFLNENFKDKIIIISEYTSFYGDSPVVVIPLGFSKGNYTNKKLEVSYSSGSHNLIEIYKTSTVSYTHINLDSDYIQLMELKEPTRRFTEDDPYGEEEWDD